MKQKFFAVITAMCLAACIGLACIGCSNKTNNDYSETFSGAVSKQTFDSVENAVKGFLEAEISGKSTEAVFVDYQKEADLSQKEINSLDLGDYTNGLLAVEKGTVEYTETKQGLTPTAAESTTQKRTVYILTYTDMFRFFVPTITTGESLTASYYDSTFTAEKYINCTMEAVMTEQYVYDGVTYIHKSTATAKVTETALYEYDLYEDTASDADEPKINTYEAYGIEVDGFLTWVHKRNDEFTKGYSEKIAIKDFFTEWFDMRFGNLDHTYFEKTETGYSLRSDKYNEYLKTIDEDIEGEFELSYIINITDGRMADVSMKIAYEGVTSTMTIKFYDFGNTKIDIPEKVYELFSQSSDE